MNSIIDLQQQDQWVLYHAHSSDPKIPLSPILPLVTHGSRKGELRLASATDPDTWGTYIQATARISEGLATGYGFVFAIGGEYAGIDLDHCVNPDTRQVTPWATRIVALLDSYTEYSPSYTGLHIYVKGSKNVPEKRVTWSTKGLAKDSPDFKALEIDSSRRYFRTTGEQLPGSRDDVYDRGHRLSMLLTKTTEGIPLMALAAQGFTSNRNDAFMALGGLLRNAGFEEQDLISCLSLINDTCNDPPAPQDEIEYIARSAAKYEKGIIAQMQEKGAGMPIQTGKGGPVACGLNAKYLLPQITGFSDIWFNEFDQSNYVGADEVSDRHLTDALLSLETTTLIPWRSKSDIQVAISSLASLNPRHPVRDYLNSLTWDGEPRLLTWLTSYTHNDDPATGEIGRVFLTSAVARIMVPGCEVRQVLLLTGPQNIGKSKLGAVLASPKWFTAGLTMALGDKDALQALLGNWVVEIPELSAMSKSTIEATKAFISRSTDKFRAPYDRLVGAYPRQCVIIATSNEPTPLTDTTGNTRFLPVHCTGPCDVEWLTANRDQLWAEAVQSYRSTPRWWGMSAESLGQLEAARDDATETDAWEQTLAEYFLTLKPEHVSLGDLIQGALGIETAKIDPRTQSRVSRLVMSLCRRKVVPYERGRVREGGAQKSVYRRLAEAGLGNPAPANANDVF